MRKCFFSKRLSASAKCAIILLVSATAFLLSGCAEALIGCKNGNVPLFFSSFRDFACPEEPTDAVDNVRIVRVTPDEGEQTQQQQIVLEWDNPAQRDLHAIEVRWNVVLESATAEPRAITNAEGEIDTQQERNGVIRILNVRPNERMQQSFIVYPGMRIAFVLPASTATTMSPLCSRCSTLPRQLG